MMYLFVLSELLYSKYGDHPNICCFILFYQYHFFNISLWIRHILWIFVCIELLLFLSFLFQCRLDLFFFIGDSIIRFINAQRFQGFRGQCNVFQFLKYFSYEFFVIIFQISNLQIKYIKIFILSSKKNTFWLLTQKY